MNLPTKMIFGIIILALSLFVLLLFQIAQLIDAKNRSSSPRAQKWFYLMLIPVLGLVFSIYYYEKVKADLQKENIIRSYKKKDNLQPKSKKTTTKSQPKKVGGLISAPVSKTTIKKQPPPKKPIKPKIEKKKTEKPQPIITQPTIEQEPEYYEPQTLATPTQEAPLFRVKDKQKVLIGYGEQRKLDRIERDASQPPIRGRERAHEIDKVELGENGLLLTYGLHRFEIDWKDIFMLVAGQVPIGHKGNLMADIFSRKNYAPYRIFDQKIMYQQFMPKVSYNADQNFREFLRSIVARLPQIPMDPDTIDFISDDTKRYSNTYKNFHQFDLYVWKIRNQVLEKYNIKLEVNPVGEEDTIEPQAPEEKAYKPQKNQKFALILRDYEPKNKEQIIAFIMKILQCSPQKAQLLLAKTPKAIAKNVPQEIGLKLSRKFADLGANVQGIPMEEYEKMKREK